MRGEGVPPPATEALAARGVGVPSAAEGVARTDTVLQALREGSPEGEAVTSASVAVAGAVALPPPSPALTVPAQLALAPPLPVPAPALTVAPARREGLAVALAHTLRLRDPCMDREAEAEALGGGEAVASAEPGALAVGVRLSTVLVVGLGLALLQRLGASVAVPWLGDAAGEREAVCVPLTVGLSGAAPVGVPVRLRLPVLRGEGLRALEGVWEREAGGEAVGGSREGLLLLLAPPVRLGVPAPLAVAPPLPLAPALGVAAEELLAPQAGEALLLPLPPPLPLLRPDTEGEAEAVEVGAREGVAGAEAREEGVAAAQAVAAALPVVVEVWLPPTVRLTEGQALALPLLLPGAALGVAVPSSPLPLGLWLRLLDMLPEGLTEAERLGKGEALLQPVGAAL